MPLSKPKETGAQGAAEPQRPKGSERRETVTQQQAPGKHHLLQL